MEVTTEIKCPTCGDKMVADVFEYETETGIPSEDGFHAYCKPYTEDWNPCSLPYMMRVNLNSMVHKWMIDNKVDCR